MSTVMDAPAIQPKHPKLMIILRVILALSLISLPIIATNFAAWYGEHHDDHVVMIAEDQRGVIFADDNTITGVLLPGEYTLDKETQVYRADNISLYDHGEEWPQATITFGEVQYFLAGSFYWEMPFDKVVSHYNEIVSSGKSLNVPEDLDLGDHALIAQALQSIVYADVINTIADAQYNELIPMLEYAPIDRSTSPPGPTQCWQAEVEPINWLYVLDGMQSLEGVGDTITFTGSPSFQLVFNSTIPCDEYETA